MNYFHHYFIPLLMLQGQETIDQIAYHLLMIQENEEELEHTLHHDYIDR